MTDQEFVQMTRTLIGVRGLIGSLPIGEYLATAKAILSPTAFDHVHVHASVNKVTIQDAVLVAARIFGASDDVRPYVLPEVEHDRG